MLWVLIIVSALALFFAAAIAPREKKYKVLMMVPLVLCLIAIFAAIMEIKEAMRPLDTLSPGEAVIRPRQ